MTGSAAAVASSPYSSGSGFGGGLVVIGVLVLAAIIGFALTSLSSSRRASRRAASLRAAPARHPRPGRHGVAAARRERP